MRRRPALTVSEERGVRHLHVGGEAIQSAMRLADPFALELDYTRCMMAFLLFHPAPRRALMIGLGGGSLAKFFHRRLPGLRTHVVEYDERVIATARSLFHVPADDDRLTIEHGDGVEALAPECCDLLVVDGFEDEATPSALVSQAFFDAAWCALEDRGALVMNFMDDDRDFDRNLQRLERAFGGAVLAFHSLRDPNIVVIGLKGAPDAVEWAELRARAAGLEKKYGLPFPRYVERLRSMNQWTADALRIVPREAGAEMAIDPGEIAALAAAAFVGSVIFGITGFGSALVTVPFATHFMPLTFALALFVLMDLANAFRIGFENPKNAVRSEWTRLIPTILLGTGTGLTLLVNLPRGIATFALGAFVLAFALYTLLRRPDAHRVVPRGWAYVAGFAGGVTSTLFGAGGPPYAMYLSQRGLSKEQYRATLGLATLTSISIRTVAFTAMGFLLDAKVWVYAAFVVPAGLAGIWAASHLFRRMSRELLMRAVVWMLLASGASLVLRALA